MLEVIKFIDSAMNKSNNYVVHNNIEAVIIDAGFDVTHLIKYIEQNSLKVKFVLLTHGHFDHIIGLKSLDEKFDCPIYISKPDYFLLKDDNINMYTVCKFRYNNMNIPEKCSDLLSQCRDICVLERDIKLNLGDFEIKIIETPGHTAGSNCYLISDNLFSGDTLFKNAIGRTDLPTSDRVEIINSIKNKLFVLNDNTKVYPGHSLSSTIGEEKMHNRCL